MAPSQAGHAFALKGSYTMHFFFIRPGRLTFIFFICTALGLVPAFAERSTSPARAFARIYVENRCYQAVNIVVGQDKNEITLPTVSPRNTELVFFTQTRQITPDRPVLLARRGAAERRVNMESFLEGARSEKWTLGKHTVSSWFVTLCQKNLAVDDPQGQTSRPAVKGEKIAEYAIVFFRQPDSNRPANVFAEHPVLVSLNGNPLRVLQTDSAGKVRFYLPASATGEVRLETAQGDHLSQVAGRDLRPVRIKQALGNELVLVQPKQVIGSEDW